MEHLRTEGRGRKDRTLTISTPSRDVFITTCSLFFCLSILQIPPRTAFRLGSLKRASPPCACVSSDVTQAGPSSTPAWSMNVSDCSGSHVDTETTRPYLPQFPSKMLPTATRMSFFKNLFKEVCIVLLIPTRDASVQLQQSCLPPKYAHHARRDAC